MKVKELIEKSQNIDGEVEIFVENIVNPCGNISEVDVVEVSTYGCFGDSIPCVILKHNFEEVEDGEG